MHLIVYSTFRRMILPLLAMFALLVSAMPAHANWTLTNDQRAQFLEYYAPIILKRGNGNKGDHGRDWITNFDFDRDYVFSDNKREWKNIGRYIDAAARGPNAYYQRWDIRPTLYTSLIEYMDGGQKNLVLFYHVYHAMDNEATGKAQLHDWERIEIHIKNVSTVRQPGYGEQIKFAVITQHSRSVRRYPSSRDFNLMSTGSGKHLLIWQAEWSGKLTAPHGQELRFIEDSWNVVSSDMSRNRKAEVEIIGTSKDKNVHYAFIPGGSSGAVSAFNARVLNYQSAPSLTSRYDNGDGASWSRVPRIQYELQDIADIIPTHWAGSNFRPHWTTERSERIRIDTPFRNRTGKLISGLQTFYTRTNDVELEDGRGGYPGKSWLWGTYEIREVCGVSLGGLFSGSTCLSKAKEFDEKAYAGTARGDRWNTRLTANGYANAGNSYWGQHDYFVHSGVEDSRKGYERGFWLTKGWQLASNGGFDGRWVSLFDDNASGTPTPPAVTPLSVSVRSGSVGCYEYSRFTATASGGKAPYTHQWKIGTSVQYSVGGTSSSYTLETGVPYTVTIRDAAGATVSRAARYTMRCTGGSQIDLR